MSESKTPRTDAVFKPKKIEGKVLPYFVYEFPGQSVDVYYDHACALELELAKANRKLEEKKHCDDCCCAQSWKALGVTEYTGKSIPEHITELTRKLEVAKGALERCADGVRVGFRPCDIEVIKKAFTINLDEK